MRVQVEGRPHKKLPPRPLWLAWIDGPLPVDLSVLWRWYLRRFTVQRADFGCGADVPNLHRVIGYDHSVDQQLDHVAALIESSLLETAASRRCRARALI